MEYNSSIVPNEYDTILLHLVQNLQNVKYYSGCEGGAYFINNQFVVKEYCKNFAGRNYDKFDASFENYINEISQFAEDGYSVPRIYSWLKIPNTNKAKVFTGEEMPYKYYVLEENVPGRWIYYYYEDWDEMYHACKRVCSKEEFDNALSSAYGKQSLKKELLKAFIGDYLNVNKKLEAMSDNEFEKFIVSAYQMASLGKFSGPDLFRKNVLVTNSRITLIDNRFREDLEWMDQSDIDEYFLHAIIDLMEYNKCLEDNWLYNMIDRSLYDDSIGETIRENRVVCSALMQKTLNILNKKMGIRPVRHEGMYQDMVKIISETLMEEANKVVPMIQTAIEKE